MKIVNAFFGQSSVQKISSLIRRGQHVDLILDFSILIQMQIVNDRTVSLVGRQLEKLLWLLTLRFPPSCFTVNQGSFLGKNHPSYDKKVLTAFDLFFEDYHPDILTENKMTKELSEKIDEEYLTIYYDLLFLNDFVRRNGKLGHSSFRNFLDQRLTENVPVSFWVIEIAKVVLLDCHDPEIKQKMRQSFISLETSPSDFENKIKIASCELSYLVASGILSKEDEVVFLGTNNEGVVELLNLIRLKPKTGGPLFLREDNSSIISNSDVLQDADVHQVTSLYEWGMKSAGTTQNLTDLENRGRDLLKKMF